MREETGAKKTTYDGFKEQDDAVLLVNLINWLADQESYTSLTQVDELDLDEATVLHAFEVPEASTEPQPEPWSAPAAGYKWWDRSTFKPGSYGGATVSASPVYSLVHQEILPNAEEFQIRVVIENLAANLTVSGFSAGIYLTGGTQVAMTQRADGTWPTAYGYGETFSLTADAQGQAYKDLTLRIKPGTSGTANLRLRQNGSNLLTKSVLLDHVPAEPLPDVGSSLPELITIAEGRNKPEGSLITVQGTVTTEPGIYGGQAFYLQDATGGVYVYQSSTGFHQGDVVKLTGSTALYNTELELTSLVLIEKTGESELPEAAIAENVSADNQGQLIALKEVEIKNIVTATPSGSFEFDALSGNGTSNHVRVDVRTGLTQTDFPYEEGDLVNLQGVSSIFRGVYQLKVRGLSDISLAEVQVPPVTTGSPSQPVLSDNNGYATGLRDGDYQVTMNLWWGNNGSEFRLYEDGVLIETIALNEASPSAQSASVDVTGKTNGVYTYVGELVNASGVSKSQPLQVVVSDASPGKPVLSHDNWDADGNYLITASLWWGTNATEYRLYENGVLIDTQSLSAASPSMQQAASTVKDRAPGLYAYYAEWINAAGVTQSDLIQVRVEARDVLLQPAA